MLWLYAHLPLTLTLTALGVGMAQGIGAQKSYADPIEHVTVSLCLGATLINLAALRLISHYGTEKRLRADASVRALLIGAALSVASVRLPLTTTPFEALTLCICAVAAFVLHRDPGTKALANAQESLSEELTEG